MTRSEITKSAIEELTARGARVRQVHNVPFNRNRRHHIEPGWPDIQGYNQLGTAVYVEVKTKNDRLSDAQIARLNDAKACGCICGIATENEKGKFIMNPYENQ